MKRRLGILIVSMVAAFAAVAQASDVTVDVLSAYVWRGQVLNDEAVLQPAFTAETPFGLYFNAWGNVDLTDQNDQSGEISEIDLLAAYALPLGEEAPVSVEVGVVTFTFPKEGDCVLEITDEVTGETTSETVAEDLDTSEAFINIEGNCPLTPALSVNYDFDQAEGLYVSLGVSHEIEAGEQVALSAEASLGYANGDYNEYYFGVDDDGLNDANVSLGATFAATEAVSLGAKITYTWLPDSDIEDAADLFYYDTELFYGGVNLTYTF
ncbi:MAG: MipA/OmpV family protein [Kiritimatiellae bacterium]|nr:MipA/OmpV family protein [Kiritimatiellia bacterium]